MNWHELREWSGLAVADIPCWLAGLALLAMIVINDLDLAPFLAGLAVLLSMLACYLGMRPDPRLSIFTNRMRYYGYPLFIPFVFAAIYYYYWHVAPL